MKVSKIFLLGLSALLIVVSCKQTTLASEARTIQGYAIGCSAYLFDGVPTLKINFYKTSAEALNSKTTPLAPATDVVVDFGPGDTLVRVNPDSAVRLICAAVMAQAALTPVTVHTNANNVVTSVRAMGQDIVSDAYALMSEDQKIQIATVVKAYLDQSSQLRALQEKQNAANDK